MSIFASLTTSEPIPIPFDLPHTVTVRKLTGREVEAAQTEHLKCLVAGRSARGWSGAFQRILAGLGTQADAEQVLADPLAGYDRFTIVRAGLLAWSYPQAITPVVVNKLTVDALDDLDDDAVEFIAREIMRLTKPALFQTQPEAEAARKNAVGSSIAA